jgi:hypothetical protein
MRQVRKRLVSDLSQQEIKRMRTAGKDAHVEEDARGRIWLVDYPGEEKK